MITQILSQVLLDQDILHQQMFLMRLDSCKFWSLLILTLYEQTFWCYSSKHEHYIVLGILKFILK